MTLIPPRSLLSAGYRAAGLGRTVFPRAPSAARQRGRPGAGLRLPSRGRILVTALRKGYAMSTDISSERRDEQRPATPSESLNAGAPQISPPSQVGLAAQAAR